MTEELYLQIYDEKLADLAILFRATADNHYKLSAEVRGLDALLAFRLDAEMAAYGNAAGAIEALRKAHNKEGE